MRSRAIWGKATNYEIATRIPLIIRAPGMAGNGRAASAVVESIDLYPTLAGAARVGRPSAIVRNAPEVLRSAHG